MTIEIRRTRPDEYRTASRTVSAALLFPPVKDADWERSRAELGGDRRRRAAWDGDDCVGHAGQFFVETTVPGGALVATGAVTRVGVLPTHRRRRVATSLLEALINEAVERSLTLMSLRASEAVIYHRYGFGIAGEYAEAAIDTARRETDRRRHRRRLVPVAAARRDPCQHPRRVPAGDASTPRDGHPTRLVVGALPPRCALRRAHLARRRARRRRRIDRRLRALRRVLERRRFAGWQGRGARRDRRRRRRRAGAVGLPVRHRPGPHLEGRRTSGRRHRALGRGRQPRLHRQVARRRAVGPRGRRRRRVVGAHVQPRHRCR